MPTENPWVNENDLFTATHFETLRALAAELEDELTLVRELILANPQYPLRWKNHPQFRKTRSVYLSLKSFAEKPLKRRTRQ
jgi:CHASE1-domain containing sensor protein